MSAAETVGGTAGSIAGGALGGLVGSVFGPVGTLAGRFVGARIGRLAGAAAASAIADMIETADETASKELSDEAAEETCKGCGDDPCKHLRRGKGSGPYRGGAHGETRLPIGDKLDSHHIPAKDAYDGDVNDMPAIQMQPSDHGKTMSNGNKGAAGARWRKLQAKLIREGRMRDAIQMDIDDARRIAKEAGDPTRYDEAIREMEAYAACRQKHGLDSQPPSPDGASGGSPSGETSTGPGPTS